MGEFTFVLVGVVVFCLLVSLIYAKKQPPTAQLFDPKPADYAVTIWADKANPDASKPTNAPHPHRITVEYVTRLQANSPDELAEAQTQFVQRCNADFHRQFTPLLGAYNIGAVLCQPANERE